MIDVDPVPGGLLPDDPDHGDEVGPIARDKRRARDRGQRARRGIDGVGGDACGIPAGHVEELAWGVNSRLSWPSPCAEGRAGDRSQLAGRGIDGVSGDVVGIEIRYIRELAQRIDRHPGGSGIDRTDRIGGRRAVGCIADGRPGCGGRDRDRLSRRIASRGRIELGRGHPAGMVIVPRIRTPASAEGEKL